jgi:hypothetical protein
VTESLDGSLWSIAATIRYGSLWTFVMHGTARLCGAIATGAASLVNEAITSDARY